MRSDWVKTEPAKGSVTVKAHGRSFTLEAQPGKITRIIRRTGRPYEHPLLEHIYAKGFEGVAIDAGANFGNHTLWLAAICGLRVEAFEPIQHHVLARNVARNRMEDRVGVHPVALGEYEGTAQHTDKGVLIPAGGKLPVVTLDGFGFDDVSVMKVDVEGWEYRVLAGATDTISRCRPVIYAETWGQNEHDRIAAVLEPLDYTPGPTLNADHSLTPVVEWQP